MTPLHQDPSPLRPQLAWPDRLLLQDAAIEPPFHAGHRVPDIRAGRDQQTQHRHGHRRRALDCGRNIPAEPELHDVALDQLYAAWAVDEEFGNIVFREDSARIEEFAHSQPRLLFVVVVALGWKFCPYVRNRTMGQQFVREPRKNSGEEPGTCDLVSRAYVSGYAPCPAARIARSRPRRSALAASREHFSSATVDGSGRSLKKAITIFPSSLLTTVDLNSTGVMARPS